ncbi:MAG TPA: biopolymer transporter ExbD [Bdellovibrionales bacterium]|nr:biopolymer transporter ExbD [Bdellovibrionales bacterium]
MAQAEEGGKGRTTQIELNLVPFIDLMSVLITFLLITAVWSQVSMIQLGSSIYGKRNENQEPITPPPLADIPLRVDVKEFGYRVIIGSERFQLPKIASGWDTEGLKARLKLIKEKYPEKSDGNLTVDDVLPYEALIIGMDTMIQGGFQSISVITAEAE